MSLIRRRMMLVSESTEPQFQPFPVSPWNFNAWLENDNGSYISDSYYNFSAVSTQSYSTSSFSEIKRDSGFDDSQGNHLLLNVFEYNGNSFVRKTTLTSGSNTVILDATTNKVRFRFAYSSDSGLVMTQSVIDQFFNISVKE